MQAWMADEKLANYLTNSVIPITKDEWAKGVCLSKDVLENISWGYGIGLQQDNQGNINLAFHYGDMNQWRSLVTINPTTKTGVVFFANSPNGLILSEQITKDILDTKQALEFIRDKFSFAITLENNWEEKQEARGRIIGFYLLGKAVDAAQRYVETATYKLETAQNQLAAIVPPKFSITENNEAWNQYDQLKIKLTLDIKNAVQHLEQANTRLKHIQPIFTKEQNWQSIDSFIRRAQILEQNKQTSIMTTEGEYPSEHEWLEEEKEYQQKVTQCQDFKNSIQQLKEDNSEKQSSCETKSSLNS